MKLLLGLTGSIGMGKSTTARMFVEEGCALWDADAAVHRLYAAGGAAVAPMAAAFDDVIEDGAVSREKLRRLITRDPEALARIEAIVHPLVAADRDGFARTATADIIVFDVPLLFEKGIDKEMDLTVCVSTDPETQRARVMARGSMTPDQFETILAKQMSDAEKRARADHVIHTDTLDSARSQVRQLVEKLRKKGHA